MSREHGLMEEYKNNGLQGVVKRVAYYLPNHYVTSKVKTTQLTYGLNKIEKKIPQNKKKHIKTSILCAVNPPSR